MIHRAILIVLACVAAALAMAADTTTKTPEAKPAAQRGKAEAPAKKAIDYSAHRWLNEMPPQMNYPGVSQRGYYSESNKDIVGYCVYLPPGYDAPENSERRYPVVYLLHGGRPGSELKMVPLIEFIHPRMESGEIPPMIYVFANGGAMSHYDYPRLGSFGETAFFKELIPQIDANYRSIKKREGRGIEGGSQGGRGTARYILKHPEMFVSAVPMFGGHQHEKRVSENNGAESEDISFEPGNNTYDLAKTYMKTCADGKIDPPKVLVVVGDKDFNYEANLEWMDYLVSLEIPFEKLIVKDAPHSSTAVYEKAGARIMAFHAENFRRALGGDW